MCRFVSSNFSGVNQSLSKIANPIVRLFFFDFGDGLVAVNFAAFLEIHFKLLLGIAVEPLL